MGKEPNECTVADAKCPARVLRIAAVLERVGVSKTTVWRLIKRGLFPAPRRLSEKTVGWLEADITAWIESRRAQEAS